MNDSQDDRHYEYKEQSTGALQNSVGKPPGKFDQMLYSKSLYPQRNSRISYFLLSSYCYVYLCIMDRISNTTMAIEDKPKPSETMELS